MSQPNNNKINTNTTPAAATQPVAAAETPVAPLGPVTAPVIPGPLGPVTAPAAPTAPVAPVAPAPLGPLLPSAGPVPVPGPVQPAPVAPAPAAPVVQETVVSNATPFTARIDAIKESGTNQEKALVAALDAYVDFMKPGAPVAPERGVKQQYTLWKTILALAENAPKEQFNALWNILLAYFDNYKDGVFHDRYLFRFIDQWIWSENDLKAMQNIFNLLQLTANPAKRKEGLARVQLEKTLATGINDEGRDRINLFYLVG